MSSMDASVTTLIFKMCYFCHLKRHICLIKLNVFSGNFDFKYKKKSLVCQTYSIKVKSKIQNVIDEVCLLLRWIFTVVKNLSETTIGISQKLRRINSIKLNHGFFHCTCLRVFFFLQMAEIYAYVTNFAGYLHINFTQVFGLFYQID